ncbi:MAG: hypothetical protein ACYDAR_16785 [Thermomicrobiales bacterium]
MAIAPTIDNTHATAPLPNHRRTQRLFALYAFLGLVAVLIGVLVGMQRHSAASDRTIVAPTEQSVIATAPSGLPTPTPLATKQPSPTAISPTEPPPTVTPPTPAPPAAPVVVAPVRSAPTAIGNQNGQHDTGKGKEKEKGD